MPRIVPVAVPLVAALVGAACAGSAGSSAAAFGPEREPPLPPPPVHGPLALSVVYPPPQQRGATARAGEWRVLVADSMYRVHSRDSAFIFGSAGRADASVTVNGVPVTVYPTGGWIAWLPLPDDSLAVFDLVASAGPDTALMHLVVPIARGYDPPRTRVWIDSTSFEPSGDRWVRPGEVTRLRVRAAPGASVRAHLPDGTTIAFHPEEAPRPLPWGERAFGTVPPPDHRPAPWDRHVARHVGPLGPDPGSLMAPDSAPGLGDSAWVWVEAVRGADTARARWPLRLGVIDAGPMPVVMVNDDTAGTGRTDGILAGRPTAYGTYHWFFPTGTIARVSGRWNGQIRLQLSRSTVAWVDAADVQPLGPGTLPPRGKAGSMRLVPGEQSVVLRVPLPGPVPFRVDETEREVAVTLYGVAADMDWIQYSGTDPFVRLVSFAQPAEDITVVTVALAQPVWGYRTRWAGHDLLLEIRRPPVIDRKRPLAGRRIVLDPGHPPAGATGPTGVREPDIVLAVAQKAKALLEARGAAVILTRTTDEAVSVIRRTRLAERVNGEILISVHVNALPDGVNPFVNHGTSVYYFHPRSAPLARYLDQALVHHFGSRDLGMGRGDLALARPTWMPAALTEGLFVMLPDQEAVLASEEGQARYARGIVDGIRLFLRERAAHQW